jgi:Tol biopolymer transport system component/DNA-binding winged helix-turn-helix (wHTH) protein
MALELVVAVQVQIEARMIDVQNKSFMIGDWVIQPELNALSRNNIEHHVEPKVMQVLLTLAAQPNHVVSKSDLIAAVWPDTFVSDDVLTRCISILRRVTEDDPHSPHFIQTVPKAGYRLVAPVVEQPEPELPALPVPTERPSRTASSDAPSAPKRLKKSWIWGAAIALALLALSTGLWVRHIRQTSATGFGAYRTYQFTSLAGEQTQPAFSPDGRTVAFVLIPSDGGPQRIYLKRVGTEAITPLSSSFPDDGDEFSPAWSPDGKQIAYLARGKNNLGIYLINLTAKSPARKIFIPQQPSHWEQNALSWSPNGNFLIFPDHTGSQPNSSIFQLNVKTGDARSISTPPAGWEGDLNPAYSPDGTKIAFTRASETAVRDLYWMSLANGQVHQLTRDRMNIDSLAWNRDSASIVFSSNRAGKYALWKMGLTQAQPERLPVGTEDAFQPAIGPKPGELAYTQGSTVWSIVRVEDEEHRKELPPESVILSSTQQDSAPTLSPDGRWFAIQSLRSGSQEIWISSIKGDVLRQLTFMDSLTGSPAWSNDGTRILFDSRPDGHSHIFMVAAAGGKPKQITFGNGNDIVPRWSRDDRSIYFRSNRGDRWQIWKTSASGDTAQPVTPQDGIVPQESPDGRYLYYARGDEDGLWKVPTSGGLETQVLKQPSARYWGFWASTAQGIFYLDRTLPQARIRIFDPATEQSSTYATLPHSPPLYSGLTVGDKGHLVLMTDEQPGSGRHITLVERLP